MKSARSRILALVLVLTMIFCTGCETGASSGVASQSTASGSASEANSESAPAEEGNRHVVVAMAADVSSLYAYEKGSYTNNQVLWHPYEALISKNAEMEFIPLLAESWEMADDNLTWRTLLRLMIRPASQVRACLWKSSLTLIPTRLSTITRLL